MNHSFIRRIICPLTAALIWGTAFAFQSMGAELIGPFTFNAVRGAAAIPVLALICIIGKLLRRRREKRLGESIMPEQPVPQADTRAGSFKTLLLGGLCCGTALAAAANLQQLGLGDTDAGKASFITALYIVIIPLLGLFLRRRTSPLTVLSVAISVAGLYFLCINKGFSIGAGDIYVIACALCFAVHIMLVDHFSARTDAVALSLMQFIVMTVESAVFMFIFETPDITKIQQCLGEILYVGVVSGGIGYTLQIISQKGNDPTIVSLLFSLESVFGALAGAVLLHEVMSGRELFGSVLMLAAVILAQIPESIVKRLFIKRKHT